MCLTLCLLSGRVRSLARNFMRMIKYAFGVARPPGAKHVRHQHPANFVYALSGGKLNTESASGTREAEVGTDAFVLNKSAPWHEVTNTGDTTARFLVIEMKYQK